MDARGKVGSGFRMVLKSVGSFGRRNSESSIASDVQEYQRPSASDVELPQEELKMSTRRSQGGFTIHPNGVPKGHLPVYVGVEKKRFVIRIKYLSHKSFKKLLDLSEETIGIERLGGLRVDCEPDFFEELLQLIEKDCPSLKRTPLAQIIRASSKGTCLFTLGWNGSGF